MRWYYQRMSAVNGKLLKSRAWSAASSKELVSICWGISSERERKFAMAIRWGWWSFRRRMRLVFADSGIRSSVFSCRVLMA